MIITLGIDSGGFGRKSNVTTCMVPGPPPPLPPEDRQTPGSLDSTKLLSFRDYANNVTSTLYSLMTNKNTHSIFNLLYSCRNTLTYLPFKMPMVRVIENNSLSFSNNERHTLE